jgi:hypothetical protein
MKITYTSFNGKIKLRGKTGSTQQSKIAIATLQAALKELQNNPDCTAVTIRLTKEVK